jgi:lysophospholipase L1-like esterase
VPHDVRVAFVGDSFTAGAQDDAALGWVGRSVARARTSGWDLTGYNLGVRRETTPAIADRLAAEARPRLRDGDAHGLVVNGGINDTTVVAGRRRVTAADTLAALDRVIDTAADGHWPLLVVGPALVGDAEQNERIVALSQAMGERCAHRDVRYVEIAAALVGDQAWTDEVSSVDGAHPRASGYERLTDLVWPAFHQWLDEFAPRA